MSMTPDWKEELLALCDAVIEDRLTEAERARLEELVLGSPAARRSYVEYLHQHACLSWSFGELGGGSDPAAFAQRDATAEPATPAENLSQDHHSQVGRPGKTEQPTGSGTGYKASARPETARERRWLAAILSSAVALLVGLWSGWAMTSSAIAPTMATLVRCKACTFAGGTLPIESGARLPAGRMRLASGTAQVRFDSGALVTIQGPAELEIISARQCAVESGRVVAEIATRTAFLVQSRRASVSSVHATFGVNVASPQVTEVQSLQGSVTARLASGRSVNVEEGTVLRIEGSRLAQFSAEDDELPAWNPVVLPKGTKIAHISTASGRGRDAYIESTDRPRPHNPSLLLVKSILPLEEKCQRKAYLGFDLSAVAGHEIRDARLDLSMCPVPNAYTALFPDATFAVYGLADEALDDWDDGTLNWANAPANRAGGTALDPDKVALLGRFQVEEGVQQGVFGIEGPALAEFLRRDHNGQVTLILVRETTETYQKGLIHGFASRYHPQLPPPTLKLTVGPAQSQP